MNYVFLLLLCPILCLAQKKTYTLADTNIRIDSVTGGMMYTDVVPVEGATVDKLYRRAKTFLLTSFTNETPVIQADDKETGVVAGRGRFVENLTKRQILLTGFQQLYYEMGIEIRAQDGGYHYKMTDIDVVASTFRIPVDATLRKNPELAKRLAVKELSRWQYNRYMGNRSQVNKIVRQLKRAMDSLHDPNDG
ncbi:hypothetical protein BH09BAC4_BH09BAC4_47620 [soil metagenome]